MKYTVVTKSTNTNSFGYRSVLALAANGNGVELFVQAYGTDPEPERGETVQRSEARFYGPLTRELPNIPERTARRILSEIES